MAVTRVRWFDNGSEAGVPRAQRACVRCAPASRMRKAQSAAAHHTRCPRQRKEYNMEARVQNGHVRRRYRQPIRTSVGGALRMGRHRQSRKHTVVRRRPVSSAALTGATSIYGQAVDMDGEVIVGELLQCSSACSDLALRSRPQMSRSMSSEPGKALLLIAERRLTVAIRWQYSSQSYTSLNLTSMCSPLVVLISIM